MMNTTTKNWCVTLFSAMFFLTVLYSLGQTYTEEEPRRGGEGGRISRKNVSGLRQDDPVLVDYLRDFEILKPSALPYKLQNPKKVHFSQYSQSQYAEEEFFHGMEKGFFVEAGAFNGEDKSNTLYFEKNKGWSGLLVEPDPEQFNHLITLNRKAYAIQAGLSFDTYSGEANFEPAGGLGRINEYASDGIRIKTYPLYSMLLALGVKQVDFLSLDIEGDEMKVLKSFPWDKVKIRLMCIEVNHIAEGAQVVVDFFKGLNYTFLGYRRIDAWFGHPQLLQETMDVEKWLTKNKIRKIKPLFFLQ